MNSYRMNDSTITEKHKKQEHNLINKIETLEQKNSATVTKLNASECHNQKLQRDVNLLKQTNARLLAEKKKTEEICEEVKTYNRKLESKIAQGSKGGILNEMNKNLKIENEQLKVTNAHLDTEVKNMHGQIDQLNNDVQVYVRALELKSEEFQKASTAMGVDIKASLLYDVGFQRETAMKFKRELHTTENRCRALLEQLDVVETKNEELAMAKVVLDKDLQELERRNNDYIHQNEELQKDVQGFHHTMNEMRMFNDQALKEWADKVRLLEEQNEEVRMQRSGLQEEKAFLKQTKESLENGMAQLKHKIKTQEMDINDLQTRLEKESMLKSKISKNYDELLVGNKELKNETYSNNDTISQLTTEVERLQNKLRYSEQESNKMRDNINELEKKNTEIQRELRLKENDVVIAEQKIDNEKYDQNKIKERMESENAYLRQQLEEAIEKAANSLSQGSTLEQDKKSLQNQLDNAKNSKKLLQRTMSEQLYSLKTQLDCLKEEKRKCDDAIKMVSVENERLQKLCEAEQKRNYELIAKYKRKKLEMENK